MKRAALLIAFTPNEALFEAMVPGAKAIDLLNLLVEHDLSSPSVNAHVFDMMRASYSDDRLQELQTLHNVSQNDVVLSVDGAICHQLIVHALANLMAADAKAAAREVLAEQNKNTDDLIN
jgi:hypothetical protein